MPLFQPSNCSPSLLGPLGSGTVDAGNYQVQDKPVNFSWQVNGNEPMTAWQIKLYTVNKSNGQEILRWDSGKKTTGCPFYGTDASGNVVLFTYTLSAADSPAYNTPSFVWKWIITQWWGTASDSEKIVQASPSVFNTSETPTLTLNSPTYSNYGRTVTWTGSYTGGPLMWVRWQIYTDDGDLIDDTGEIATQIVSYTYTGLSYGTGFAVVCTIQNTYGMQASVDMGYGSMGDISQWFGYVAACTRNDLGGAFVRWPVIRSTPTSERTDATIITPFLDEPSLLKIQEGGVVRWTQTNGAAFAIPSRWWAVWRGTLSSLPTHIFHLQLGADFFTVYVKANGTNVYLNNNQIATAPTTVQFGDEMIVAATNHRIFIKVLHNVQISGAPIATFSAEKQGELFTSVFLDEDDTLRLSYNNGQQLSEECTVAYPVISTSISGIYLYGPQVCKYFWVFHKAYYDVNVGEILSTDFYPSWTPDYDTWFLTNLTAGIPDAGQPDYRWQGGNLVLTGSFAGADIYRQDEGSTEFKYVGSISSSLSRLLVDYAAKSNSTATYRIYFKDSGQTYPQWYGEGQTTPCFADWDLVAAPQNADGSYTPNALYRFRYNVETGAMSNNNSPNVLQNFTQYPTVQLATANYKGGTLTGYIGSVDAEGNYTEQISARDALFALSTSNVPLFIRNRKGDFLRVSISAPITATVADNTRQQMEDISVPWVEIDETSHARVFLKSSDPLYKALTGTT